MRQIHEVIRLCRNVSDIPMGTAGVVMFLSDDTSCYLAEFPDPSGEEIKLVSISEDDLAKEEVVISPKDQRLWSVGWQKSE